MSSNDELNIAVAQELGWAWYRIPDTSLSVKRGHRCLFLPLVHEFEGQDPRWLVRADGSENVCSWSYMNREGHVLDYSRDMNEAIGLLDGHEWILNTCETGYKCCIHKAPGECGVMFGRGVGATPAEAICRAFLEMKKGKP